MIRAVLFCLALATSIGATDDPAHFSIQGTVVNSVTGEPLRNASVAILGAQSQDTNANLSSDGGGRFTIPNLPTGDYTVSAAKQGFSPTAPVHVALSADQTDILIKLLPFGRINGTVVDDAGDPILNANIQLFRAAIQNGRRVMQPASHGTTNDLGEYHVASLPPGRYYVEVRKDGYWTYYSPPVFVDGNVFGIPVELIRIPKTPGEVISATSTPAENVGAVTKSIFDWIEAWLKLLRQFLESSGVRDVITGLLIPALVVIMLLNTASAISTFGALAYLQWLFTEPFLLLGRRPKR